MSLGLAALFALCLIGLLFSVAALVEARSDVARSRPRMRRAVYTLGLGVYCSSWTFYGAVGSAVRDGWNYLPIYLAPCLLMLTARGFLVRLANAANEEKATTISDFIAARFGHDPWMARLVTLTALCGIVPYGALQLRSIGSAIVVVSGREVGEPVMITAAAVLALFAILFGARRYEVAGRNEGMLFSVALESVIKIVALVIVAGVAVAVIHHAPQARVAAGLMTLARRFSPSGLTSEFAVIALVSAMAIIVLPRQFFMAIAEARASDDLSRARFGVAGYIAAMAVLILPIALAGIVALPADASPDLFVLRLPVAAGMRWAQIAALLGGLSSAAAMVIVDSTALAIMVSNDLIFPAVLRTGGTEDGAGHLGLRMMGVRRLAIVAIIAASLAWALLLPARSSLASIGLIAFAAMAQFTPHLVIGVLGKGRDAVAGKLSLGTGFALWLWTLALPPILPREWLAQLSGTPIDPLRLFGIGHSVPLVHGVLWSLSLNLIVFAGATFGREGARELPTLLRGARHVRNQGELAQLAARFIGDDRAEAVFPPALHHAPVDRIAARRAQDLIAGVVGASSARALVASALAGGQMGLDDVTRLLDEGRESLRFSRQLLAASFENLPSGISVIDSDLNLVAWNSLYLKLFGYPSAMVRVGIPVADLIRFNIERGDFDGSVQAHVDRRLARLRNRQSYVSERLNLRGRVIRSVGGPMPGGGYLTAFTDITREAQVQDELERTLEQLESRVADRTRELSDANRRLAESAIDKTRFLAAASHDLLQPLHAARLFLAALDRQVGDGARPLVGRVERSIIAADNLLRALLDISRLDAGGIQPTPETIALAPFLRDLVEGIRPLAEEKGLRLVLGPTFGAVRTDPGLLRSVLQNLLTNAVRYTTEGGVVVGVRRRGSSLRVDVIDSGVGIASDQQAAIFTEFTRLGEVEAEGLGLGLAIVDRIVNLLGLKLDLRSRPGHGSRFSLVVAEAWVATSAPVAPLVRSGIAAQPMTVLVVDNDRAIIEASVALLSALGHTVLCAGSIAEALPQAVRADAALVDYDLDHGEDGITLADRLRHDHPRLAIAIVSAERGAGLQRKVKRRGLTFLYKPVAPADIEAFLAGVVRVETVSA